MADPLPAALAVLVSIATWSAPQPQMSAGLLVTYGNQQLVEANAAYRGYDLGRLPDRCGLAAISPAMLGSVAWVRVPGGRWLGPCLVVDAVGRAHAYESIYVRQEVAEVSRATAAALGFEYGAWGHVYFGPCPPADGPETRGQEWSDYAAPELYAPPLVIDYDASEPHRSFYPYPQQQRPGDCPPT